MDYQARAWQKTSIVEVDCRPESILKNCSNGSKSRAFVMFFLKIFPSFGDEISQIKKSLQTYILRSADMIFHMENRNVLVFRAIEHDINFMVREFVNAMSKVEVWPELKLGQTCNIGVVSYPKDGNTLKDLINNAGLAAHAADQRGIGAWEVYSNMINNGVENKNMRPEVEVDLHSRLVSGLLNNEFFLAYQGQVDTRESKNGRIIGVEALIRWDTGVGSGKERVVMPGDFIPYAEHSGLIVPLNQWVLRQACAQLKIWMAMYADFRMAVNVSTKYLLSPGFIDDVDKVLTESGVSPQALEIEITESELITDIHATNKVLEKLKERGLTIVLDDFGVKYSSLEYLRTLLIDKLKIDMTFVHNIEDPKGATVVRSIINMARGLGLDYIAEGVETPRQAALLEDMGCYYMQGFLFFRPEIEFPVWG